MYFLSYEYHSFSEVIFRKAWLKWLHTLAVLINGIQPQNYFYLFFRELFFGIFLFQPQATFNYRIIAFCHWWGCVVFHVKPKTSISNRRCLGPWKCILKSVLYRKFADNRDDIKYSYWQYFMLVASCQLLVFCNVAVLVEWL